MIRAGLPPHSGTKVAVLPKVRSFTANSGTKAAVLPKASIPLQTQEPRLQFYQGWIGAVTSRCFFHPTLSLASEQTLKGWEDTRGTNVEVRRVDLTNWALQTLPKFTISVLSGFLTRAEIRKSQSPFAPNNNNNNNNNNKVVGSVSS